MQTNTPPLWKQVFGAVGGAAIALLLYGGWHIATPRISAWLTVPPTESPLPIVLSDPSDKTQKEFERIAQRARLIAENLGDAHAAPTEEMTEKELELIVGEEEFIPEDMPSKQDPTEYVQAENIPAEVYEPPVTDDEPEFQSAVTVEAKAPALPSSGLGMVLIVIFACGAVTGVLRSRGWFALGRKHIMQ